MCSRVGRVRVEVGGNGGVESIGVGVVILFLVKISWSCCLRADCRNCSNLALLIIIIES